MSFSAGDRVVCTAKSNRFTGATGTVLGQNDVEARFGQYRVMLDEYGPTPVHGDHLAPHVDTFPLPADKDPWAKSAPNHPDPGKQCGAPVPGSDRWVCSKAPKHTDGYHLSRTSDGVVHGRWPQSAPPAEKPGPVVGMEVVRADVGHSETAMLPIGARGKVTAVYANGSFDAIGIQSWAASHWGTRVVPAAEWDARQKRDTERAPPPNLGDPTKTDPELTRIAQRKPGAYEIRDGASEEEMAVSVGRIARALFELDMRAHAERVGDDGKGGIGAAEVLERMWNRLNPSEGGARWEYMWRAAIVLKRAGDLK